MKHLTFLLEIIALVAGCKNTHRVAITHKVVNWGDAIVAWNEDSIVNYRIAFFRDHTFWYTTEDTIHDQKIVTGYKGRFKYARDTMFLFFKGKTQPPMHGFLIRAVGGYFSQQFRDHRPIMYLRYYNYIPHDMGDRYRFLFNDK